MKLLSILHRLSSLLQLGAVLMLALFILWWLATLSQSIASEAKADEVIATAPVVETANNIDQAHVSEPANAPAQVAQPVVQTEQPVAQAEQPVAQALPTPHASKSIIRTGDRLKVAFFEQLAYDEEQKWGAKRRKQAPPVSFRQRTEFSGEYEVEQDGFITIPLLGSIEVADRTLGQVENHIRAAYERVLGRLAFMSVNILQRPVFVLGPVKNPGTYKFAQGLTVLHLIALSGGFDRGTMDLNHMLDTLHGVERKQKATATLQMLLARLAVLSAEKTGAQPAPARRLTALAGIDAARKLVDDEAAARQLVLVGRREKIKSFDVAEAFARSEVQDLRSRRTHVESTIKLRSSRVAALNQLGDRVARPILASAEAELSGVKEHLAESDIAVTRAEAQIKQITHDRAQLVSQADAELASEILSIRARIMEAELSVSAQDRATEFLSEATAAVQGNREAQMRYEIIRVTDNGPQTITASGTDLVRPGDLVRISIAKP